MDASLALPILFGPDRCRPRCSTSSTVCTTPPTRSLPSSRRACCGHICGRLGGLLQLHCLPVLRRPVAQTVGRGIVAADIVDARVIFGALMGAITWNVVTWLGGIPSSCSHALIGGLVGAGLAKAGISAIVWSGVLKTAAGIVVSPLMGFLLALLLVLIVSWLFVRFSPFAADRIFRNLQFVSASLYSLGHGGNDAQKTMGIITALLFSQGISAATSTCRSGSSSPATAPWDSAPCWAAGGSCTRWARASRA